FEEKERALAIFADHVAEVKTTVPPEKLLVFDVREGWEPLCAFLEVPVPDQPFPHVNDRQVLQRLVAIGHTLGWLLPAAATAGGLFWWWRRRRR
ncbi:MAG: sulfotransferase family protein, partial [Ardenticatenales bacterium]|nr:sulfotransferase family protein [Ardenticatenales bacterium]